MSWPHAYGAFLGVLCGDAAGATLEFFRGDITAPLVESAMRMPGGGVWEVGRGQITDDSELALSLARALAAHMPRDGFPMDAVAQAYHAWFLSRPYDMGNTCGSAFSIRIDKVGSSIGAYMMKQAAHFNSASEANGSLMRIVSLAIWGSALPDEQLVEMANQETRLSHPHQVCQDCNAVYCLLIAHLIRQPGDRNGALAMAEKYVRANVHSVVRDWFLTESLNAAKLDCSKLIGHARWAFCLAIYHLRQNTPYKQAIHDTLLKGGDTDTNAAIVGGLLGALHGESAIPAFMKEPVLAFDCTAPQPGRKRPEAYRSAQLEELTRTLLANASHVVTLRT